MARNNTPFTDLDFFSVKNNLKDYLRQQPQFADYDFDGSNLNVLLDVLAYNAYQNNFYTNMAISEMFLDSAQLRESVVSHSKELNYLPNSRKSATSNLKVRLSGVTGSPNFVIIPAKTRFTSQCGSKRFTFTTESSVTVPRGNSGVYEFDGLKVHEGTYRTELFNVEGNKRFAIRDENIDISSLRVFVRTNVNDQSAVEEYTVRDNIFGVKPDNAVFYLQAYSDNRYEITFGQDTFGKQPVSGNVIVAEYRTTLGEESNGANNFSATGAISGYGTSPYTIDVLTADRAAGGSERESTESIRFFAPKSIQIQDRAITESDYEILLKNRFSEIQAVTVFGGEEMDPPQYGRVIVAVDVANAEGASGNDKERYKIFLDDRSPIAIEPVVISPEFMYLDINTTVYYDTNRTSQTTADIQSKVSTAIKSYNTTNLSDFKSTFRFSKLLSAIDNSDQFITSNDTKVRAIIPVNPELNQSYRVVFTFANALAQNTATSSGELKTIPNPTITSSSFTYRGEQASLIDNGKGVMQIVKTNEGELIYLNKNVGSVNYETGRVVLSQFNVSAYEGSEIRVFGQIASSDIKAPKTRITTIRDSDVTITVLGK